MAKIYYLPVPVHLICFTFEKGPLSCQWTGLRPSLVENAIEPLPANLPIKKVVIDSRSIHRDAGASFVANSDTKGNGFGIDLKKGTECTINNTRDEIACIPTKKLTR